MFLHTVLVMSLFSFGLKANDRERRLEGEVERLNEELLRARRALKSAVTLQVLANVALCPTRCTSRGTRPLDQ